MPDPIALEPRDEYNQELQRNVHPNDWVNPTPNGRYNLVVIGAGTAGLVTAAGAAGLGAKVALIERSLMGGDCLNVGCVPSKAIISAARFAAGLRRSGEFGIEAGEHRVDFAKVMQRMRRLRAGISPHDSAHRFRDLGVDVYFGQAAFLNERQVEVAGATLDFKRAVVATGGRAMAPPLPGIDDTPYLTNESVFSLTELPRSLAVIGAGPIGVELAQSFARLGSRVELFGSQRGLLPKEDREAAAIVEESLKRDGVGVHETARNLSLRSSVADDGSQCVHLASEGGEDVVCEQLLVAAGRAPNVEGLQLKQAGVAFDERGVLVNDKLQTSNHRIYAAGDVCSKFKFTHAADFMARIAIQNALFMGRARVSRLVIPWTTYTSPEVAQVGLNVESAEQEGIAVDVYTQPMSGVDRAILDGETDGFARILCAQGKDRILGATIVASHAGDLIAEVALAMKNGIGLKALGQSIHPYPTQAEAIRKLGDQFNRTRLTSRVKSAFQTWLRWTR